MCHHKLFDNHYLGVLLGDMSKGKFALLSPIFGDPPLYEVV